MSADEELSGINRRIWIFLPLSAAILVLLSSLMQNKDNAALVTFESLTQNFASSINLIHARWVQLNKPNSIQWQLEQKTSTIILTQNGWPIVKNKALSLTKNCDDLWLNILGSPLDIDGEKIFSSLLFTNNHWVGCKYHFSELSFNYWLNTGRVEAKG